jgi:hypothetical protein
LLNLADIGEVFRTLNVFGKKFSQISASFGKSKKVAEIGENIRINYFMLPETCRNRGSFFEFSFFEKKLPRYRELTGR